MSGFFMGSRLQGQLAQGVASDLERGVAQYATSTSNYTLVRLRF
jgi:hypothetical protein